MVVLKSIETSTEKTLTRGAVMPTLTFLNVVEGDKSMFFEDEVPEKRAELAQKILELQKSGYALFLIHGQDAWRVRGYDDKENEWVLMSSPVAAPTDETNRSIEEVIADPAEVSSPAPQRKRGYKPRRSAKGTEVSAVAPTAGG